VLQNKISSLYLKKQPKLPMKVFRKKEG